MLAAYIRLLFFQGADLVADTAAADADSDDESAADMEEFEESGMLDADDPVSAILTTLWGVYADYVYNIK